MKFYILFDRSFPIPTWILPFSFALFTSQAIADPDEDKFVSLYGNDVNTSGIWQQARDIASDEERLKNVSLQAHDLWWTSYIRIDKVELVVRTLTFTGSKYDDINADMIKYVLVGVPERPFFITKGFKPECAFHLWKVGWGEPKEFQLKDHVCGITFY